MDQEKLYKIKKVFEEALKLTPSERKIFVERECIDDPELKNEVVSLLNSFDHSEDFLEKPPLYAPGNKEIFSDPLIGTQIGSYFIEGEAGFGGMGIVYSGKRKG